MLCASPLTILRLPPPPALDGVKLPAEDSSMTNTYACMVNVRNNYYVASNLIMGTATPYYLPCFVWS
jgi:hypothetical protein